jgi:Kef-type K+ transport system membrane component KefB
MTDADLARFFLALVLVLTAALAGGHVFERLKLPRVIGEIAGGIVLGPSLLGLAAPEARAWLFGGAGHQAALLSAFYWLGLVLLMFTAGFRLQSRAEAEGRRIVLALVLGAVAVPFAFGFLAAPLVADAAKGDPLAFRLVMGIGAAVTSIPVIARLFLELRLMETRFARDVVAAATLQDLLLWVVLAVATAVQHGKAAGAADLAIVVGATVAFAALSLVLGPALVRFAGRFGARSFSEASLTGYALLVCLFFVAAASLLGINVVFGALVAGLVIGRFASPHLAPVKQRIADIAIWFFVPIYFALVGVRLDLAHELDWALALGFVAATTAVKLVSVMLAARLAGAGAGRALDYAVAMNTRGGPGIVLASVAHAAGIIDDRMFTALVLASILTSLATGIWFRWRLSREPGRFAA